MEKIIDLLTSEHGFESSKIVNSVYILTTIAITASWYQFSFGEINLSFNIYNIIDFVIKGKFIPSILLFGTVYFIRTIIEIILINLYSFLFYRRIKKIAIKLIKQESKTSVSKGYLKIAEVAKPLLIQMGFIYLENGDYLMDSYIRDGIRNYCKNPRETVYNLVKTITLVISIYIVFLINFSEWGEMPLWFQILFHIVFYMFIIISFTIMILLSIIEVNIDALKILYKKIKPLHISENTQNNTN